MIPLGLSVTDQRLFEAGLRSHHSIRISTRVLDLDQNMVSIVRGRVLSGQVDVDATQDVDRSLSMTLLDHDGALNLDQGNAYTAGLYVDRMVSVRYEVWSPAFPTWVSVPVFTGPIATLTREGDTVSLTAQGKEALMLGPCSYNQTWAKGSYKTSILAAILAGSGEQYTDIPHWTTKTTKPVVLAPLTVPWELAKSVARSWGEGRILYDGRGVVRLYRYNPRPRWTFKRGQGGTLESSPKLTYDASKVRNMVVVTGATPSGAKAPVRAVAHAPKAHPLSSTNLGRGGKQRWLREDIQDDTVTTVKQAQALADARLAEYLQVGIELTFEAGVIPHLEPFDVVNVQTGSWTYPMSLHKFTIPLTADGKMVIGRNYAARTVRRPRMVARKGPRRTVARHVGKAR